MNDHRLSAFMQTLFEVLRSDFNMENGTVEPLKIFSDRLNEVNEIIDWNALRRSVQMILDILASIPDDVQKTPFFQRVDELKKGDFTYECIEWFVEDIRNEVLIKKPDENAQTDLSKYIEQIKTDVNLGIREKVIILLAHMEPLMYETLNYKKIPKDNLKNKVKEITVDGNKGMSSESLAKVYVYGICSIVFARTDFFNIAIDMRLPFRNNILHNGILSYSEDDLKTAYELLVDFMDALIIIKRWIPIRDTSDG